MSRWLRTVRSLHGLDQAEFGDHIGKSRSTIASWEASERSVPVDVIATIRSVFPDSPVPPVENEVVNPRANLNTSNLLLGRILYAGVMPANSQWGDALTGDEYREIEPKFCGPKRFLGTIQGDSCWPALQPGDLAVWEKDLTPPVGMVVLAERMGDQSCTVKELAAENGRVLLRPLNPTHPEPIAPEGWAFAAKLVGVLYNFKGAEMSIYIPGGIRASLLMELRGAHTQE